MSPYVGIVLISHSSQLAAGLATLVEQLSASDVPVEWAGGTDDGRLGSSYPLVRDALQRANHGAGAVVLSDLGSSVLTARAVLADEPRPDIMLADAPFVEGAVAATIAAACGSDLRTVHKAAEKAWNVPKS